MTGAGLDSERRMCFRCFELFEEEGGPQLDPKNHERATAYSEEDNQ